MSRSPVNFPPWNDLYQSLSERIQTVSDAILNGRCADYTAYKERVAERKTLVDTMRSMEEAVNTYLREDEDDD